MQFRYGPTDQTSNRDDDLSQVYVRVDPEAESANAYGVTSTRQIASHWIQPSQESLVIQTAGRLFAAFTETPLEGAVILHTKDADLMIGDLFDLDVEEITDATGANQITRCQVTSRDEIEAGTLFKYTFKSALFRFGDRFAFIAPDLTPDYSAASDTEKLSYSFIAPDTGVFSDGNNAYSII